MKTAISPTRQTNFPEWYQQVIKAADLAEISSVRGCMLIKPWGYGIWEIMQQSLDQRIKATGHQNIYCPLFIPLKSMQQEADHVAGFAKECAVVTHHRLVTDKTGKLIPAGELEEPLIVRPTSEMIIGEAFSRWIQSHRDLPVLVNQWANIVRWEMRPRMFLRTSEFLWQEGHTAHATAEQAQEETRKMLECYIDFVENELAIPVIAGEKTENERFPGAVNTYTIEAMMQDGKALQAGTSHFLGQKFAKSCNIQYTDADDALQYAWTTSWGVSTRLIGGLIMTHADDNGLILPPKIAPKHIVILPLIHKPADREAILNACQQLASQLQDQSFNGAAIRVDIDTREQRHGDKAWQWVKKGVPIRIEIGAKELTSQQVSFTLRIHSYQERQQLAASDFVAKASTFLEQIHQTLYQKATDFQQQHIQICTSQEAFYRFFQDKQSMGFVYAPWVEDTDTEKKIRQDLGVSARCIPLNYPPPQEDCPCIFTGKAHAQWVMFGRAY